MPKSAMLGAPGEGLKIALSALDGGRIGIASQAIGIARSALSTATEYARDRRQFGQAIGEFQAIQWKLADAATELDAAQLLAFRAAFLKEKGAPYSKEASMAKLFATEAGNRACHAAVQVLGGYGYIREYPGRASPARCPGDNNLRGDLRDPAPCDLAGSLRVGAT